MKKALLLVSVFALVFATACKKDKKEQEVELEEVTTESEDNSENQDSNGVSGRDGNSIWVVMESKSGSNVGGHVIFEQEGDRVTMLAALNGLEPGVHAIHLHESSDCSAEDGTSTGGHWNPTGQPHGEWGANKGYHKGDIGNFTASEDGRGTLTFSTDQWCIGCGDETKDILGKAVIVHQGADDFVSQPTGAAGGRVSCGGVIE
ncbi:superoxide dismutase family protein [Flavobacteriaceae sp. LMIT009]